jgi:tRNA(Met) C34 N-acetyltransferase TmcA
MKTVLTFSGGIDSTYVLWKLLSETQDEITAIFISSDNLSPADFSRYDLRAFRGSSQATADASAQWLQSNVRSFLGEHALERYDVQIRDAYEGIDGQDFDRVVLDLPEPWNVVPHAEKVLRKGGLLVAYTPSITQAVQVRQCFGNSWIEARTMEVLHRTWHIEGMAVRPDHRMVAHTAFLTVARFIGANSVFAEQTSD